MNRGFIRGLRAMILIAVLLAAAAPVAAQESDANRPVDMMILIDNSCSMFPQNMIITGCDVWGSDPGFLRIIGADLFLARLGFGEPNEDQYQAGVISFGDTPTLISPLQPLTGIRDAIATKIANPRPGLATSLVPAMKMGYDELENSPNRKSSNLPAMVLITDGVPWPTEGQSEKDIENLVTQHEDVQLFVMLLQGAEKPSKDFQRYIQFWKSLETRYTSIFVYLIQNAAQIEETYNGIIAQIQSTIPTKGVTVTANQPLKFFVSQYLQKLVITIVRRSAGSLTNVVITDSQGKKIEPNSDGVGYFRGQQNPVEIYSITAPRLSDKVKNDYWTITSDNPVTVLVDREGTYRINVISPVVAPTEVANVFRSVERESPVDGVVVRMNLLTPDGVAVKDPQRIWGQITAPNGVVSSLADITTPDSDGVYTLRLSVATIFPDIMQQPGRFVLQINAGSAEQESTEPVPIASARLILDVGRAPYIRNIAPQPLECRPDWSGELRVSIGDYDATTEDKVHVAVSISGQRLPLSSKGAGIYSGDLTSLCQAQMAQLACSGEQNTTLTVLLDAVLLDGTVLPTQQRDTPLHVMAPACTATPYPTATPTPTPTPTPIPDRDKDGLNDAVDRCPDTWGLPSDHGCLPIGAMMGTIGGLVLMGTLGVFVWPWVKVRTVSPPPMGYLVVCREGERGAEPISIYDTGMIHRVSKIKIGSNPRRAHIVVDGMMDVEFIVERMANQVAIREIGDREPFAFFDQEVRLVRTSDPKLILKISSDSNKLGC